jgi:arabinogalactan oligomer/maltooligosaccharide transport system permease protein
MSVGRKKKSPIGLFFSYALLTIIAICCLYPALWTVMASFKPGASLLGVSLFPKKVTIDHYHELFTSKSFQYGIWYWNTLKIATLSMLIGSTLVIMTSYSLSRFRFNGRKTVLSSLLVLGMFPGFMSMIAIYILLLQLDLLNTHAALVLVYSAGAPIGMAFVGKGLFDTIPRSLEEAARIDGATNWMTFRKIMLPLSKPAIIYIALLQFTGPWMDFFFARLVLRTKEKWTIAVGLWDMVANFQSSNFTMFAAGSVLIAVPITILFMLMQGFFVDGLTAGANKG